jgi:mono/diheme cytochrome c family protein
MMGFLMLVHELGLLQTYRLKGLGLMLKIRIAPMCLIALCVVAGPAWSQESSNTDDVQRGHKLAVDVCAMCHVAAPDQLSAPVLRPPAPSFQSIAQRPTTNPDSIRRFLTTTHMGLDNPNGMPNPSLLDFQIRQVTAYLLTQRTASAPEQPSSSRSQMEPPNNSDTPDLGDLMGATQLRHLKLSYAGTLKNWELAKFEVREIRKSFDAAAKRFPTFQDVPLAKLVAEVSEPALKAIDQAITAKDSTAFPKSFGKLTEACNSCHQAARVGFIVIRSPTASPFSNQSFEPTKR